MAEPQQPPPASPPPSEDPGQPTAAQAAELAAVLAGGAATAAAVAAGAAVAGGVVAALLALLTSWGYDRRVARVVVTVVVSTSSPLPPRGGVGAVWQTRRREPVYDAWFVLNATRRAMARMRRGKGVRDAVKPEVQYFEQRQKARAKRREAAEAVEREAGKPGTLEVNGRKVLMWRAHADDKVTWECVAADGRWFYADTPPMIGYPGTPHGGTCRCWAVQATPAALRGDTVDQAVRSAQGTAAADHKAERIPSPPDTEAEAS